MKLRDIDTLPMTVEDAGKSATPSMPAIPATT